MTEVTDMMPQTAVEEAQPEGFNLELFEAQVWLPETEPAARSLSGLLAELENHYGGWGEHFSALVPGAGAGHIMPHICTRIAGAVTVLFCRPDFQLSDEGWSRLMGWHRWLALIFAVSSYRNADHIIRRISAPDGGTEQLTLDGSNLRLFCLCYFPDSAIPLQPDALWQYDRRTVIRLFMCLLSGRCLPTPAAHEKREQLLAWLPAHMDEVVSPEELPLNVLHDVYMHCSYADLADRHRIKQGIGALLHRTLADRFTVPDNEAGRKTGKRRKGKPLLLVIPEWFTRQHSIYRTHSVSMRALKADFRVEGLTLPGATDEESRMVFDSVTVLPAEDTLNAALQHIRECQPDVIYYPSVGMHPLTVFLSNMRLAPVQLAGLGHPATTGSECIDGILVERDYTEPGTQACFTEKLYTVDSDAMPYVPPSDEPRREGEREPYTVRADEHRPREYPVRVAVCASIMKINPGFLSALAEVRQRSRVPVRFCFLSGGSHGLVHEWLSTAVHEVLPDAEVWPHLISPAYRTVLESCELFVSPFPFGNTNGLVDAVRAGLPGVCLTGSEVLSHIDEGLFRRLGLPEELITRDREGYISAVVRLAEEHAWREELQSRLCKEGAADVLFRGQPEKFAAVVKGIYEEKVTTGRGGRRRR